MTRPAFLLRSPCAALLAALLLLPARPAGGEVVYPRLGLYGSMSGDGQPFLNAAGNLDPTVLDQVARYDEVILDASPISEYRPDILGALRARNPHLTALAYVLGHDIWDANRTDSLIHFPTRYNHLVRDLDGYLYNKGGRYYSLCRVNLAKRDSTGRYVVAEALADLFHDAIVRTGLWDGLFLDVYCDNIGWSQTAAESIDVQRAGYPDEPSFGAAWRAASDTLASRLRTLCGLEFILVGNCGFGTKYGWFDGWMRENFPYQGGGTWYENMFRVPGGYFVDEASFRKPTHDYIFSMVAGLDPYTAANARKVRFGLGSASLGTGFGVFGPGDRSWRTAPYHAWWYDEYAVDLATGRASARAGDTGWLGTARGPWYQMIWAGTGPDAVSNPDFETSVTDGWTFYVRPPVVASLARDTTTAGRGRASAHITITTPGTTDWFVTYASLNSISLVAGRDYSATFWARASAPRRITVMAGATGYPGVYRYLDVGTEWQQYQVGLVPFESGSVQLMFFLGLDAGDVWLDDAHLQPGATNLYRRDFQNGTVLVNPAAEPLTVPLGGAFRKILGTVDPATNDGSWVTEVTVPASDALFLLGRDTFPPAAPRDLRIVR